MINYLKFYTGIQCSEFVCSEWCDDYIVRNLCLYQKNRNILIDNIFDFILKCKKKAYLSNTYFIFSISHSKITLSSDFYKLLNFLKLLFSSNCIKEQSLFIRTSVKVFREIVDFLSSESFYVHTYKYVINYKNIFQGLEDFVLLLSDDIFIKKKKLIKSLIVRADIHLQHFTDFVEKNLWLLDRDDIFIKFVLPQDFSNPVWNSEDFTFKDELEFLCRSFSSKILTTFGKSYKKINLTYGSRILVNNFGYIAPTWDFSTILGSVNDENIYGKIVTFYSKINNFLRKLWLKKGSQCKSCPIYHMIIFNSNRIFPCIFVKDSFACKFYKQLYLNIMKYGGI